MSLLDSASLICTPNGYKEGKLYSVIPSDGSGDMSVVRATTATRVNSAGLVELVPYNLVQYSEQIDNAAWGKVNATITSNATTAPDGTLTADKFESTSASPDTQFFQVINSPSNTISFYAKEGNINILSVWIGGLVSFNLNTGTVTAGTATMENAGNGWWRCIISTTYNVFNPFFSTTASGQFVYVWGCQANEGTILPYQKTETRLNIPRLDYSNGTCPSLLVEPQRTNILTYSSSFDNAAWTKGNGTVTANATTSPSGITNADKFAEDSSTDAHYFGNDTATATSGQSVTFTIFAKQSERSWIAIRLYSGFGSIFGYYNIANGTLGTIGAGGVGNIEDYGNGWYRCSLTITMVSNSVCLPYVFSSTGNGTITFTGTTGSGVYVYGAQLEVGSYPTSYIPTTSASVTRNADVISKTGISSLIGQTEGTLFWEGQGNTQAVGNDLWLFESSVNDTDNAVLLYYVHSSGYINCYINNGSSYVNLGVPMTITDNNKVAVGYKSGDFVMYVNGAQVDSNTSATAIPSTMNQVAFNKWTGITGVQKQSMKAAALWKTRLTNTQLATLTSL